MDRIEIFHKIIESHGTDIFYGWGRKLRHALEDSELTEEEQKLVTDLCSEKKQIKRILSEPDDSTAKPLIDILAKDTGLDVSLVHEMRQAVFHYGESPVAMVDGDIFSDGRFRYRVVSGRRMCAELLGTEGNVGAELKIPEHVNINGKEHRVISIASEAFMDRKDLVSVDIPHWVESIGDRTFMGCTSLSKADLNNLLREIGEKCFSGTAVTEVVTQESLSRIGKEAYNGCPCLKKVSISKKVKTIGEGAFACCKELEEFIVSEKNGLYSSEKGILYSRNKAKLIQAPGTIEGTVDVLRSVTTIESGAFDGCTGITKVDMHANVTTIGDRAFRGCTSVKTTDIPKSVTSIGESSFENCTSITKLELPHALKTIGRHAFRGCTGIITVDMPCNVSLRNLGLFDGCTSMTRITIRKGTEFKDSDIPKNAKVKYAHEQ